MAKFGKSIMSDDMVEISVSPPFNSQPQPTPVAAAATTAVPPPPPPPPQQTASYSSSSSVEFTPMSPEKAEESWVKSMWRPAMGWLYMLICLMDFVIFPAIAMFLPVMLKGIGITMQYAAWQSLTLSNGGLIHMAFGAILGVAAYGRTQEKVASKQ
jgi:hypothetical protein